MTTKRNLLLVSLFLVFGLATMTTSALAQTQWTVGANQNQQARAEGEAEATGQITLTTTSVGTVGAGTEFVIYFTTSNSPGGTSAGLSGPPIKVTNAGTVTLICNGSGASPWIGGCGGTLGTPYLTTTPLNHAPVLSGPALHIPFATSPAFAGPLAPSFLSVTARVDVTPLYPAGGSVYAITTAFTPTGVPNFTITPYQPSPSELVDTVRPDPALSVVSGLYCSPRLSTGCEMSSTAYVLLCLGVIHHSEQFERYFTLNVDEEFTYALTSSALENSLDSGSTSPGLVTNGTMITVVLNNIPTNFGVSAGDPVPCTAVTSTSLLYCLGGTLAVSISGSDHYWNSTPGNTGTATFEYNVDTADAGTPENTNLPFKFYSAGPIGTSALPCVTATVYKQPNTTPSTDIPRFKMVPENGPGSAAVGAQAGVLNVICFNNCQTNLLYPLVLNIGLWDTDLAISNTTMDPLALIGAAETPPNQLLINGSATPQQGVCWLYFFSGGALTSQWITPIIKAGSTWTTDTGAAGTVPAGDTGYVWAKCFFSQAYGYAAIDFNFGGNSAILADYLAINVPDPEWSPRDENGDGMGENSLTPFNLSRSLRRALSGLH